MIEMLGVLAIIGVLSVGGIAGYSKAMMKYRINKTIEQISLITGNVRTFFKGNYNGVHCLCSGSDCSGHNYKDGCPIIKKAKLIPDEMLTIDSTGKITAITNAFGGKLDVTFADKDDYNVYGAFHIQLSKIPEEACIELASHDWSSIGINVIARHGYYIFYTKTPLSIDDAILFCREMEDHDDAFLFYYDIVPDSFAWKDQFTSCSLPDGC